MEPVDYVQPEKYPKNFWNAVFTLGFDCFLMMIQWKTADVLTGGPGWENKTLFDGNTTNKTTVAIVPK